MAPSKNTSELKSRPSGNHQSHQHCQPESLSSTSSQTARSGSVNQQSDFDPRTFYAGTAAYTQYGVTENLRPESQQRSANNIFAYAATIAHHDLQGQGSQSSGQSSAQSYPRMPRIEDVLSLCPYHRVLLQDPRVSAGASRGLAPMDRYVAEGPAERHAILHRPITEGVPTHSGCRCLELMQGSNNSSDAHAKK